jgi:hypothetical protein
VDTPAAAVGDPAELLDVDVHEVAGGGVLVAAHHPTGGPVRPGQPGHAGAGEHPVDGGGVQAEREPEARRPAPPDHPDLDDAPLGADGRAPRTAVRPARAVVPARRAVLPVAAGPAPGGGRRHLEPLGGSPQGPALVEDTAGRQQPTTRSQGGSSVGNEDLRAEERFLDSSTPHSEVFLMSPVGVTNVRGQYT